MDDENDAKLVFFDKRDDFDLMPVNETSREPPQAEMAAALAEELALVNQRMSQQVDWKHAAGAGIYTEGF